MNSILSFFIIGWLIHISECQRISLNSFENCNECADNEIHCNYKNKSSLYINDSVSVQTMRKYFKLFTNCKILKINNVNNKDSVSCLTVGRGSKKFERINKHFRLVYTPIIRRVYEYDNYSLENHNANLRYKSKYGVNQNINNYDAYKSNNDSFHLTGLVSNEDDDDGGGGYDDDDDDDDFDNDDDDDDDDDDDEADDDYYGTDYENYNGRGSENNSYEDERNYEVIYEDSYREGPCNVTDIIYQLKYEICNPTSKWIITLIASQWIFILIIIKVRFEIKLLRIFCCLKKDKKFQSKDEPKKKV